MIDEQPWGYQIPGPGPFREDPHAVHDFRGGWLVSNGGDGKYVRMSQDAYDAWLKSIGDRKPQPQEVIETRPGRCECGSEAAGSMRHSTWCPAFEK